MVIHSLRKAPALSNHELYRLAWGCSIAGHYITDVNCVRDGTWKSFNDSMVVEMKEEDVRQRRQCTGYIFFYMYK